jgi:hypothetical protein
MKVLIIETYYPRFLVDHYRRTNIADLPYAEQRRSLFDACFGVSDFYSRHLRSLGVEAEELIANCAPLQLQWARENEFRTDFLWGYLPARWTQSELAGRVLSATKALLPVVAEQVRRVRPDVLYLQDLTFMPADLLRSLKSSVKLVVGQIASPLPPRDQLDPYDLILTSFPHYVSRLREAGLTAEYFRLGFDPSVLARIGTPDRVHACTFVGGISREHSRGVALLELVARNADVTFFGYGAQTLRADSPILPRHRGPAWGLDMYRALGLSRITLNRHIDVAEGYANNMRLYEATGMGAMLITDAKANLQELFDVGKEVVTYDSAEDAAEKISYYSAHPAERDAIAHAGQARTLREHTYEQRMRELVQILQRRLRST